MPKPSIDYEQAEGGLGEIDYEKTIEFENEEWRNRIWLSQTLGGHYKLYIKTEVTNKSTDKSRSEKDRSMILKERGWMSRKLLGNKKFKKKDLPDVSHNVKRQVNKLANQKKTMKSEQELLQEVSNEFEKQLEKVNFEEEVEAVR